MKQSDLILYDTLFADSNDCVWILSEKKKTIHFLSRKVSRLHGLNENCIPLSSLSEVLLPCSFQYMMASVEHRVKCFFSGDYSDKIIHEKNIYVALGEDKELYYYDTSSHLLYSEEDDELLFIGISRQVAAEKSTCTCETIFSAPDTSVSKNIMQMRAYFFDKFLVYGPEGSSPIKWRTSKTEELFAFVLSSNSKTISKNQLLEVLWPEVSPQKSSEYLHTTLYYLKKNLGGASIKLLVNYYNDSYTFSLPEYYSDVAEFSDSLEKEPCSVSNQEYAISLYKNHFLEKNGYSWAATKKLFYENIFNSLTLNLIKCYYKKESFTLAKKLINKFLLVDELNEKVFEYLLKILVKERNFSDFKKCYQKLSQNLMEEFGTIPSESIQSLYNRFICEHTSPIPPVQ